MHQLRNAQLPAAGTKIFRVMLAFVLAAGSFGMASAVSAASYTPALTTSPCSVFDGVLSCPLITVTGANSGTIVQSKAYYTTQACNNNANLSGTGGAINRSIVWNAFYNDSANYTASPTTGSTTRTWAPSNQLWETNTDAPLPSEVRCVEVQFECGFGSCGAQNWQDISTPNGVTIAPPPESIDFEPYWIAPPTGATFAPLIGADDFVVKAVSGLDELADWTFDGSSSNGWACHATGAANTVNDGGNFELGISRTLEQLGCPEMPAGSYQFRVSYEWDGILYVAPPTHFRVGSAGSGTPLGFGGTSGGGSWGDDDEDVPAPDCDFLELSCYVLNGGRWLVTPSQDAKDWISSGFETPLGRPVTVGSLESECPLPHYEDLELFDGSGLVVEVDVCDRLYNGFQIVRDNSALLNNAGYLFLSFLAFAILRKLVAG